MKNLYLYQDVLGFPLTYKVMRRYPQAAVRYVSAADEVRPKPDEDPAAWARESLVLKQGRMPFVVPAPEGTRDTPRSYLLLAHGSPPVFHVNLGDYWRELTSLPAKSGPVRLGRSMDFLHFCAHSGETRDILEAIRSAPSAVEAWTRGAEPAPSLGPGKPPNHFQLILAIAPEPVLAAREPGGPALEARLARARELKAAGFRVEVSLEPVEPGDELRAQYAELAYKVTRELGLAGAVRVGAEHWPDERERYALYREVFKAINRRNPGSGLSRPPGGWSKLTIIDRPDLAQQAQRPG